MFQNTLFHPHRQVGTYLPMKTRQCSETSTYKIQMPGMTQKKACNIQNMVKVWNQEDRISVLRCFHSSRLGTTTWRPVCLLAMTTDVLQRSANYSNYAAKMRERFNLFHLSTIYCQSHICTRVASLPYISPAFAASISNFANLAFIIIPTLCQ